MKTKLIIFDMWNTLLKNPKDYREEIAKMLDLDVKYIREKFKKWNLVNISNEDFFKQITNNKNSLKKIMKIWDKSNKECVLFKDVLDTLKELKNRKIKLAILSNATPNTFNILWDKEIKQFFDKVYLSCEYKLKKPNIKLFEIILKDFGLAPEEAIMVGDKENVDLEPAKQIGIKTILVDRKNEIKKYNVNKIDDLRKVIGFLE